MLRVFAILLVSASCALARPLATLPPDVSALAAIFTPQPEYPLTARQRRAMGNGFFVLRVNRSSGRVTNVEARQSTGDQTLDAAAFKALRQWRFKPGGVLPTKHDPGATKESKIGLPVKFTM